MTKKRITLIITNFGREECTAVLVERTLMGVPCVNYAYVNLATEMAYVEYDCDLCTPDMLIAAIARTGCEASAPENQFATQPAGVHQPKALPQSDRDRFSQALAPLRTGNEMAT